jgi:hypothetical protein
MKPILTSNQWMIIGTTAVIAVAAWAAFALKPSAPATEQRGTGSSKTQAKPDRSATVTSAMPNPAATVQTRQPNTATSRGGSNKKVTTDPAARKALRGVGSDPEAERYWLAAINNPFLPPDERQDLIEDLNEDGLIDPRGSAADDLPLIENRIRLIEQLMPESMDRVNAEAFKEAHKDLLNLQTKLSRR